MDERSHRGISCKASAAMSLFRSSNTFLVYNLPKVKRLTGYSVWRKARKVFATIGQSFSHLVCDFKANKCAEPKYDFLAVFK
jgi:hypothetical protein